MNKALITEVIPTQGFDVIKRVIPMILKRELENQKSLKGCEIKDDINVFLGRTNPFQQSERLMINVDIDSSSYSTSFQAGNFGKTLYYIDVYTSNTQKNEVDGGEIATNRRDLFLGMIKYILDDHHYKTLGLPPGFVMGTSVEGFENFEPSNNQETSFVKMARLTFGVRLSERQSLWDGIDINTIFTDVKLEETNKGYKYETII